MELNWRHIILYLLSSLFERKKSVHWENIKISKIVVSKINSHLFYIVRKVVSLCFFFILQEINYFKTLQSDLMSNTFPMFHFVENAYSYSTHEFNNVNHKFNVRKLKSNYAFYSSNVLRIYELLFIDNIFIQIRIMCWVTLEFVLWIDEFTRIALRYSF